MDAGARPARRNLGNEAASRDRERAEQLVEEALLSGAAEAEAYLKASATTAIQLGGRFASVSDAAETGMALRVFDGRGRQGHAFSSRSAGVGGREMIQSALASLRAAAEQRDPAAPEPVAPRPDGPLTVPEGLIDPRVAALAPEEKRQLVAAALTEASWGNPDSTIALYRDGSYRVTLANSRGFAGAFERTLAMVTLTRSGGRAPTLQAEWVGAGPEPAGMMEAAASLARLQPALTDEDTGSPDLLLEPAAAATLVRRLLPDLMTDRGIAADLSFRRLASEAVTVADDGRLPGGPASAPFDGEGFPTGRLTLVKAGVRIERLRRARPEETYRPGCSQRLSYRDRPIPGPSNIFLEPGPRTFSEMIGQLERGFLVAVLEREAGEERLEPAASRWRGIGWEIREGSVAGPCRRILFRAAAGELLEGIAQVSDRVRFTLRNGAAIGSPELLIRRRG